MSLSALRSRFLKQSQALIVVSLLHGLIGFESTANAIAQETITLDADLVTTLDAELETVQGTTTPTEKADDNKGEPSATEKSKTQPAPEKKVTAKPRTTTSEVENNPLRVSSSLAIASVAQVPPPKADIAEARVAARLKSSSEVSPTAISGGTTTAISQRDKRIAELTKKLQQARNDLMVAEMEVERLSNIIEDRNQASLGKAGVHLSGRTASASRTQPSFPQAGAGPRMATKRSYSSQSTEDAFEESDEEQRPPVAEATSDMQIATVIANKANLRTGPSKDNSPLMSVAKGTRLAIEHRVGEWYRVIAPTGVRAWISGEVLAFGRDDRSAPSRTLRVQGVTLDGVDSSDNDGLKEPSEEEQNPSPRDSEDGSDEDAYRLIMGETGRK